MSGYLQVSTTTGTRDEGVELAASAVKAGLAASAQVQGPAVSVFWHQGEYGESEEWQVTLKTSDSRYADLETHLRRAHSWDNPEISAVRLEAGSADYLAWIDRTTSV
ncbi:divalent-cation tolerance protein CutA [Kribbella sp. NBC_01245]|uniref:divalent-cation tolerance protein CutA n=1 Tax=Kribbella sp. NBC_01245 TaxID=2903578 RepID=UPI002E2BCD2E|nr:divalent-cation tolerance protein CutA [Kribbella sp. NBC_01245]